MIPMVISFFTNDWIYAEHSARLVEECKQLNIDYHIAELPSLKNYRQNCNLKPKFIFESLLTFKQPVLWLDIDSSIIKLPSEMNGNVDYDIIGISKEQQNLIYVNCLYFNYTENSKIFLETWTDKSIKFIDDGAFQDTKNLLTSIKILSLPTHYNQTKFRNSTVITEDACFINRLSSSELKQRYKAGER